MTARRPTINDVARRAGVSPSTASVVFSGKTAVSDATRQRVLDAAGSLGYTGPDPRAASLRRGRSGIVGVVFEEHLGAAFLDPVKTLMMDGLTDGVASLGAGLLLLRDRAPLGTEPSLTTAPLDAAVLVGCSGMLRESLDAVQARGIPVVVIEGDAGDGIPQIQLDNREAQRQAASHVRTLGHTRVALVTLPAHAGWVRGRLGPEAAITVDVTRERLAGAREVFPDAPAYAAQGSSIDEGLAAGRALLADPITRPTAVLAQSDLLAAGVIRAADELGLRVPEQLSVTGFDGIVVDGLAPYRLTTLVQPAAEKGRAAGQAVAAMLAGQPAASIRFTCVFRVGNTTGPRA
ncbi:MULTISPECIES: LacI family DNA-binding transcriptional regulator [unclassified Microbacterium]|uniref:LacI family DNA-binding transcriptional regulator n=1 Tax=unclassified Microbacterium TaxID=2609290 RepID=UPI00214C4A1C|nr:MULTISPECIES: LacI family DNA-binding transcriptional regulator [unclassified Microbacterium]MCR2808273.1 LacI family DNA-binding transcriptional regulator [Microbacterium sp. zg.B185]WIM19272.1 LacI family DNA-binding transcriptional regulator [Microbacterium sp. zg-B185]